MKSLEDRVKWNKEIALEIEPIEFYRQHYAGLPRGKLKLIDPNLYQKLWKEGLLESVPVSSRFGNDAVAYYQEHYAGLTRGQLSEKDPSLYQKLWREGLLESVPTKSM